MLSVALLCLCLHGSQDEHRGAAELAREVARILTRSEYPAAAEISAGAAEIAALGDVASLLFEALGSGHAPADEGGDGARLGPGQKALLLTAVEGLGPVKLAGFVADVTRNPANSTRVAAALRVLGAPCTRPDARALLGLAQAAESRGFEAGIEGALDESLQAAVARDAKSLAAVSGVWKGLGPLTASIAVKVIEQQRSADALACLRSLLGRQPEYDACLLVAIGNSLGSLPSEGVASMALDFETYLRSADSAQAQAAAAGLGRLDHPDSVPALIELLVSEDPARQRAGLSALRRIGGIPLPDSANLWRTWYGREETWWQDSAPALLEELSGAEEQQPALSDIVVLARELSEHPLHRAELVSAFVPLLAHADPAVRALACQSLERLDSPHALVALCARLADGDALVVAAAHAALVHIARTDLPAERGAWQTFMRTSGYTARSATAKGYGLDQP